jgi:hypothetical protein
MFNWFNMVQIYKQYFNLPNKNEKILEKSFFKNNTIKICIYELLFLPLYCTIKNIVRAVANTIEE